MKSLYILSSGYLRRKDNTIVLEKKGGEKLYYPVENVEDIYVLGKVTLNSSLLEFLNKNRIVVHFFNYFGGYVGSFYPSRYMVSGFMLVKQVSCYSDTSCRLLLAKNIVKGSINVMQYVLKERLKKKSIDVITLSHVEEYKYMIDRAGDISELMGIEGKFHEMYLSDLDKFISPEEMKIGKRMRRPPGSYGNALLSFLNSLVYTRVLSQIYHTHLDPRIGYLHETGWKKFPLSLDIAEIFKPLLADRLLLYLINKHMIKEGHFVKVSGGIYLNEYGRKKVLQEYDKWLYKTIFHRRLSKKVSYKRLMRMEVYRIEKHLLNDDVYTPFKFPL